MESIRTPLIWTTQELHSLVSTQSYFVTCALFSGRSFCEDFKVSPYAADHNLLPHLQNIYRDGTPRSSVSSYRKKHVPDLLSETEKQLQHQIEKVRHTSQDQRAESFLGSEQRYWLRASFTQRHGKDFLMT
ncbi:hypothetical protein ABVT39_024019 [Epinephelus coioides]